MFSIFVVQAGGPKTALLQARSLEMQPSPSEVLKIKHQGQPGGGKEGGADFPTGLIIRKYSGSPAQSPKKRKNDVPSNSSETKPSGTTRKELQKHKREIIQPLHASVSFLGGFSYFFAF